MIAEDIVYTGYGRKNKFETPVIFPLYFSGDSDLLEALDWQDLLLFRYTQFWRIVRELPYTGRSASSSKLAPSGVAKHAFLQNYST